MNEMRKGGVRLFLTIPNIFTLSNLGFGIVGLYFAMTRNFLYAFLFVFLAIISDGLDGFVARKLKATNEFGKELDSLCDQVSFGVTPAVMLISCIENPNVFYFGLIVAIIYSAFGALRLARFNIYGSKEFFEGLAIPAAAFFTGLVVLCINPISNSLCILLFLLAAILMISTIAFPSAKTRIGIKTICISIIIGLIYFSIFYTIGLIAQDIIWIILWLLLSIMLSYLTTSPPIFHAMLRRQ